MKKKEIITENPFLSDFYKYVIKLFQLKCYFYAIDITIFLQDVTRLNQGVVSDYHIHKNKIFAKIL